MVIYCLLSYPTSILFEKKWSVVTGETLLPLFFRLSVANKWWQFETLLQGGRDEKKPSRLESSRGTPEIRKIECFDKKASESVETDRQTGISKIWEEFVANFLPFTFLSTTTQVIRKTGFTNRQEQTTATCHLSVWIFLARRNVSPQWPHDLCWSRFGRLNSTRFDPGN